MKMEKNQSIERHHEIIEKIKKLRFIFEVRKIFTEPKGREYGVYI
jgi:hypothetical protein